MSKFVLGLDVGYSNLVIAYGHSDAQQPLKVLTMPAAAVPISKMPGALTGEVDLGLGARVLVDDEEPWVAGIDPSRLDTWSRELHADYPSTKIYRALFHAALVACETDEIDLVVTGLPVNQFQDKELRSSLVERLKGEHRIAKKRTINVKDVVVVPQPSGTFMYALDEAQSQGSEVMDAIEHGRSIVIDPGFYSVDWVMLDRGGILHSSSGTDLNAMSKVIEQARSLIEADHGTAPAIERIEQAVRTGETDILFRGRRMHIGEYLEQASATVANAAFSKIKASLRMNSDLDVAILGGGGADSYRKVVEDAFPGILIAHPKQPVVSNAVGFWLCGKI